MKLSDFLQNCPRTYRILLRKISTAVTPLKVDLWVVYAIHKEGFFNHQNVKAAKLLAKVPKAK